MKNILVALFVALFGISGLNLAHAEDEVPAANPMENPSVDAAKPAAEATGKKAKKAKKAKHGHKHGHEGHEGHKHPADAAPAGEEMGK